MAAALRCQPRGRLDSLLRSGNSDRTVSWRSPPTACHRGLL